MENYLSISCLNDFLFCPYSIYLHNVYKGADQELYHAAPQAKGKNAHNTIDAHMYSSSQNVITGIFVYSEVLQLIGKIDIYNADEKKLIERKARINIVYPGNVYQLHAQYFCMIEMGYSIEKLAFYSMADNKTIYIELPTLEQKQELMDFIQKIKNYNPATSVDINPNKCKHCIYNNLCDQTNCQNVY